MESPVLPAEFETEIKKLGLDVNVSNRRWYHQRLGRHTGIRPVSAAGICYLHRAGRRWVNSGGLGVHVCGGVNPGGYASPEICNLSIGLGTD